jgi:molecular chaperone GrpE (heat shock protein)
MKNSNEQMSQRIQQLLQEVDKIHYQVIIVQNELAQFARSGQRDDRMALLKEEMNEIRSRLEGVRESLNAARAAAKPESHEEEIDLWM